MMQDRKNGYKPTREAFYGDVDDDAVDAVYVDGGLMMPPPPTTTT